MLRGDGEEMIFATCSVAADEDRPSALRTSTVSQVVPSFPSVLSCSARNFINLGLSPPTTAQYRLISCSGVRCVELVGDRNGD